MDLDKKVATFDKVESFSFKGIEQNVKVVGVIDGDTLCIIVEYNEKLVKLNCRLKDIDCAELNKGCLDTKGRDGYCARDFLAHLCMGYKANDFNENNVIRNDIKVLEEKLNGSETLVFAELGDFDCFGRVLVTLKREKNSKKSFNQLLSDCGYAKDPREKTRVTFRPRINY